MGPLALVTGATGFVGRHAVDRLLEDGWAVRVLARPTSDTRHLGRPGVELVMGDLRDSSSLGPAVEGVDTVLHLGAVTAARTDEEYRRANVGGTRALVEAITAAQLRPRRLVYLSSYAAVGPSLRDGTPASAETPAPLTAYGRTKLEGERAAALAAGHGVEVVVIRAPVVYGPGDRALLPYFRLVRMGLAPTPGGEDRKLHLVFAPDLALALENATRAPAGTYAVADPRVHRWIEVVRVIAATFGRKPVTLTLPAAVVRAAAAATEAVGRLAGRAVPFNREKAEEMLAPAWICDLAGSDALLPPAGVTPLEEGIQQTIRWYIRQGWL